MLEQTLKKSIQIHLKTKQKRKGESAQTFQTSVKGNLYQKDSFLYITYDEPNENGLGSSKTTLKIDPLQQHISVIRFGATQMKYTWAYGQISRTIYQTSFGAFDLTVRTDRIELDLEDPFQKGSLKIDYHLDFGGETSRMSFDLSFLERSQTDS